MIPSERAHLHIATITHPGMSGKNNEDRFAVSRYRLEGERSLPAVFAVVSDGVGGHRAGEVAAEIVVEKIQQAIAISDGFQPLQALREAIQLANQAVYLQAQADDNQRGMAATCACALVIDNRLYTASVGDSRIYLISGDKIQQLTTDHTWIQEALEAGLLTPEEAQNHPNTHVIRRYLGSPQPVEVDLRLRLSADETDEQTLSNQGVVLQPGDHVILCSDGLSDLVTAQEILSIFKDQEQEYALHTLTSLANQRGGHDNITIIALQMPVSITETTPTRVIRRRGGWQRWMTCLAVTIVTVIVMFALFLGYWFFTLRDTTLPPSSSLTVTPTTATETVSANERTPAIGTATPSGSSIATRTPGLPNATPAAETLTPWPTNTPIP
jgi:serine/threonine protein phosphatase PrpC